MQYHVRASLLVIPAFSLRPSWNRDLEGELSASNTDDSQDQADDEDKTDEPDQSIDTGVRKLIDGPNRGCCHCWRSNCRYKCWCRRRGASTDGRSGRRNGRRCRCCRCHRDATIVDDGICVESDGAISCQKLAANRCTCVCCDARERVHMTDVGRVHSDCRGTANLPVDVAGLGAIGEHHRAVRRGDHSGCGPEDENRGWVTSAIEDDSSRVGERSTVGCVGAGQQGLPS